MWTRGAFSNIYRRNPGHGGNANSKSGREGGCHEFMSSLGTWVGLGREDNLAGSQNF